ncbi:MAG: rhodanese-like domain-containing protein [SAR324 cluster bacterium]|nr:rhodanese-like domain-containing protein [SAR324 cluster bacterium]
MSEKFLNYEDLVQELLPLVKEVMPWEVEAAMKGEGYEGLVLDIREPTETSVCVIKNSLCVPRGVLEAAGCAGYDETEQALLDARDKQIIVVCRSGKRSVFAAHTLNRMGYKNAVSLKTGIRGVADAFYPLYRDDEEVDEDEVEKFFYPDA